ncbi:MAG: hypothetical protein Fur0037_16220 [Planctomycetota bacterium]
MSKLLTLLAGSVLAAVSAAQTQNNAGLGGFYLSIALNQVTGNDGHLGCAVRMSDGHIFVSARGMGGAPPHKIYEFSATGQFLLSFNQPSVHDNSPWGMRDLAFDNADNLIGGSEYGISVIDSHTHALSTTIKGNNSPVPITQPILGSALATLGTYRAIAFDPAGNNGDGSIFSANFQSSIIELDYTGSPLSTIARGGNDWSIYGMAIDPVTSNLLVNSAPDFGRISEIDRNTGLLTGNSLPMALPGAAGTTLQGGLSMASPAAGVHERWQTAASFVELTQDVGSDMLSIRRLHMFSDTTNTLTGWNETHMVSGVGMSGTMNRDAKTFGANATLRFQVTDPTNVANGQITWVVMNIFGLAAVDAYTDLSQVIPGMGILAEHRTVNPFSSPVSTPLMMFFAGAIGTPTSISVPPGIFQSGDSIRMQALYVQPLLTTPLPLASTNEIYFTRQ